MFILLSPAKSMTYFSSVIAPKGNSPRFEEEANRIAREMAKYSAQELGKILKINPELAFENSIRFKNFHTADIPRLQAMLAYTGIVFKQLCPEDFSKEDFLFAEDHLRLASFFYGLTRPLDLIKPYRMEHSVRLPSLTKGKIDSFWKDKHTNIFIDEIKSDDGILVNLASKEFLPTFHWEKVKENVRIITPEFKLWKQDQLKTVVIYAKMARGQMARYIIKNQITNPEELKKFSWEGFHYSSELSSGDNWMFTI